MRAAPRPAGRPLVVTSPATAAVRDALGDSVDYALQAEPRGTGDAVAAAVAVLPDGRRRGPRPDRRRAAARCRRCSTSSSRSGASTRRRSRSSPSTRSSPAPSAGSSATRRAPWIAIVEVKDATDEELAVNEINSGLYAFDAALAARPGSATLSPSPKTGELYLTELIELGPGRRPARRGR